MTVVPAIFKNKKAFSLVELVVTMIIASILMLSVYFMMLIAYEQFNDLTGVSENFNNLQVFEKMFQRSAMTCVYYEVQNGNTFCFLTPNNNGYKYEKYEFKDMSTGKNGNGACSDISQAPFSKKIDKYSNDVNEDDDISGDNRTYEIHYTAWNGNFGEVAGYSHASSATFQGSAIDNEKILFDNVVKVYYETSKNITRSNFYNITGKNISSWSLSDIHDNYQPVYTPFIKLIVIYRDHKNNLKRFFIVNRLRGIEGSQFKY